MTIVEDYDPSLPPTLADPDQLMQVFLNLIKNASEAAGPQGGGTIRLHTFYDLSLRLRRKDGTGQGRCRCRSRSSTTARASRPTSPRDIFEPFVSGRENGTGLGLALVSKIISDHDGWISVDSVPGRTVFRVSLPIAPKDPRRRGQQGKGERTMDGTVLVADDDRTIRTVLTQALTRAGCKVHATSSLMTLMRWVEEGKGDLVISDVIMPDGNGLEALPRIGKMRPGLPVIVISAQNTIMTAIQAAEAEAYDYLPKPFDLPDLMKRSARALDQKRRAVAAQGRTARGGRRPAAGGPHAGDAGAVPAGGPGDEHRSAGADHRRIGHRQNR